MPAAVIVAAHRYPIRLTIVDAVGLAEAYEVAELEEIEPDLYYEDEAVELEVTGDMDWNGWTNRQQWSIALVSILAVVSLILGLVVHWRMSSADSERTKRARAEACGQAPEGDATDIAACINTAG